MADNSDPAAELQRTWDLAAKDSDAAMALFYETLFDTAPEVRKLFSGVPMRDQGRKLAAAIGVVVKSPQLPESITGKLEELGARHVVYGVEDRHYDAVGAALLQTLETALGDEFTASAREAWVGAYAAVSSHMKAGAARSGVLAAE